ncbi:hypothetical protein [Methylobacterium sp. Leaf108]|uniref:hypothetical protein n=1 Tax=Methylobacterium sp. Leaf108 TaxID=1736256 RepID=UPI0007018128|nr:hypothetical protein [Methylobacterium sp. Leaf108]KQP51941.1 hypothetical protein ASF39_09340 [Methylobacterium sp. Leaf108]
MKAFAVAVIAAIGLGLAAAYVMDSNRVLAYQAFSTSGARVSHPGTNLVGPQWSGDIPMPSGHKPHGA